MASSWVATRQPSRRAPCEPRAGGDVDSSGSLSPPLARLPRTCRHSHASLLLSETMRPLPCLCASLLVTAAPLTAQVGLWASVSNANTPARMFHATVYDTVRNQVMLYSGVTASAYSTYTSDSYY